MSKQIENITSQSLNAPIPIYNDMRMGDWYSWLRESSHDGEYRVDLSFMRNLFRELSSFLSAIVISRWAKQADVDMESDLIRRIEENFQEGEHFLTDIVDIPAYDWNEKDMVYEKEDRIGDVMSRSVNRAVNEVAKQMNGTDNPYIWMFGEKEGHERPMFKTKLLGDLAMAVYREMGLVRTAITKTMVSVHRYDRKQAYEPIVDESGYEDWYVSGEGIDMTGNIYDPTSQIAVIPGVMDYSDADEFYMYLECLDLFDDSSNTVYIVGYPFNYTAEVIEVVNRIGAPVSFVADEAYEFFPEAKNTGKFFFGNIGYRYDGTITDTARKRGEMVCTKYEMERAQDIFYDAYPYQGGRNATENEIYEACEKLVGRRIEINEEVIPFGERGKEYIRSVFRGYSSFSDAKFINDVVAIYIKNEVFNGPMNFSGWGAERQELTFQERYGEFVQNAHRSGADCDIKALLNGVPIDDLLV